MKFFFSKVYWALSKSIQVQITSIDSNLIVYFFSFRKVLQWQHMLEGLPQYMCLATEVVQSLQEDVLMVGSQYPAEVINIQYRTFESNPPIAVTSPWRISKPL